MAVVVIASPSRPSANSGNDVTAARWATRLVDAGHRTEVVAIDETTVLLGPRIEDALRDADILVAIHARRSAPVIRWWTENRPGDPLVVALAGTDLYVDLPANADAFSSVRDADALVVLQHDAIERLESLDPLWAAKAQTIHQSVDRRLPARRPIETEFRVVVLAHLREVKDPLLAARAAQLLPQESEVVVHHAGRAFDDEWRTLAEHEAATNSRYVWHGELDADESLQLLASATVLACTSSSEGGANVVTEAMALGVPVVGTEIGGNTGLLGRDHPGWFPVGDHHAFARLLLDLESRPDRLVELESRSLERRHIVDPEAERRALDDLVTRVLRR